MLGLEIVAEASLEVSHPPRGFFLSTRTSERLTATTSLHLINTHSSKPYLHPHNDWFNLVRGFKEIEAEETVKQEIQRRNSGVSS